MQEAGKNIDRIVEQIRGQLVREGADLKQQARMIRDNIQLQEYLFVVHTLKTDLSPLRKLFQRQFGWLPILEAVLLDNDGKPVLGGEHKALVDKLNHRAATNGLPEEYFFVDDGAGLKVVATIPISYRGESLGSVAISKLIDHNWLMLSSEQTNGQLFIEKDGRILLTTLSNELIGDRFVPIGGELALIDDRFVPIGGDLILGEDRFLVRKVPLVKSTENMPTLWFAQSQAEVTATVNRLAAVTIALVFVGTIAILFVGAMMLRNFSTPLGRLVEMIKDVGEGRFPATKEPVITDEIAYATNKFFHMVASLREKQTEIDKVHQTLEQQAVTDVLTNHYNRRQLYDLFPKLSSEAGRQNKNLVMIIADLDKFKEINDVHGHIVGDLCLQHFSDIMRKCCRTNDFVFRLGGEEFLIISIGTIEGGVVLAEKIRHMLESTPFKHEAGETTITCSMGVTSTESFGKQDNHLEAILSRADKALYAAKDQGRNRVILWNRQHFSVPNEPR